MRFHWRLIPLLLILWALMVYRIDAPWHEYHNGKGAWVSASIRNYYEHGPAAVNFAVTRQTGPVAPEDFAPYVNHAPLQAWIPGALSLFTGFNEMTVRFVSLVATMISVCALFVVTRRLFDSRTAFIACIIFSLSPMIAYLGRSPGEFLLSMSFGLLYCAVFINWLRAPTMPRFLALALLIVLGVWSFWIQVLYAAFLGMVAFVLGRWRHRWMTMLLAAVGVLSIVALIALYSLSAPTIVTDLWDVFIARATNQTGVGEIRSVDYIHNGLDRTTPGEEANPVTWTVFTVDLLRDLLISFTASFLLLGLLGIGGTLRRLRWRGRAMVIAFYAVGLGFVLLLPSASLDHEFYSIYLYPALAITGAVFYMQPPRPRRWTRPLGRVLVLTGVLAGIFTFFVYHSSATLPHMVLGEDEREVAYETTIAVLKENTAVDDTILSNVEWLYDNMTITYYAYRNVVWSTTPEQAVEIALEAGPVVYMYCPDEPDNIPDVLDRYNAVSVENLCLMYRISG